MNFFKRKLSTDAYTNLIANGTHVDGDVVFSGIIKIEGAVKGSVLTMAPDADVKVSKDCINVAQGGSVNSEKMKAFDIVIAGSVSSKIVWAEDIVRILKTGVVKNATIYYRTLEIEPGATLIDCHMKHLDHSSEGEIT